PDFLRKTTVVHLSGAGEEGIGEDVTYHGEEHDRTQERGPDLPLAGSWTLHVLGAPRVPAALRRGARTARLLRLPPLGLRERRARPRAPAGGPLAGRRDRARAAGRLVCRLRWARRTALDGAVPRVARPLPGPSLQARREPELERGADRAARRD